MLHFQPRRLAALFTAALLVLGNVAPAAFGALTVAGAAKRPTCAAPKVATHVKQRVRVTVRVRDRRGKVHRKRVWRKRWTWICKAPIGKGPAADLVAPGSPSALAATTGDRRVALTWTAPTDNVAVTGYRVYRDGVLVGTATTNAFTDTAVVNGTTYQYLVVAFDAAGNSSAAAGVSATPKAAADVTPPTAPPSFTAVAGDRQVSLSWGASSDDTRVVFYQVFRDGVPIGAQESRTLTDTGLVNGTTYTYTVYAHDAADNVSPASTAQATPADTTPPSVPANLVATPGDAQVSLTWSDSTDNVAVTGYHVYRSINGGPYAQIATPATPYYLDTGRTNGVALSYRVEAVDAAGNASAQTAPAAATPAAPAGDQQGPTVPSGLIATPGTGQVALQWNAASDNVAVTGYRVYRATSAGGPFAQVASPVGTSYTDTGRTNGVTYWYRVTAVDAASNESAQSAAASATPSDTTAPSVPSGVQLVKDNAGHAINVSWLASTDNVAVVRYRVYRSKNGGAYVLAGQPLGTTYSDVDLSNGATYAYQVTAVDAAGNESAKSPVVSTYVS